jgi:hypothetical protein
MLSSVLKSKRAAQVNVIIIRTFVRLRELLSTHKDIAQRQTTLSRSMISNSKSFSKPSVNC